MKVLLVEDDRLLCGLLADTLIEAEFEVRVAHTGSQALELYIRERCNVLVLDLKLPDMTGLAVLEAIRTIPDGSSLPVIVFSGFNDEMWRRQALELGVDDYLVKPFDHDHLVARTRALVHRVEYLANPPRPDR